MVVIHKTLSDHFNLGESDDPQRNPVVVDNMFKVARMLQNHQSKTEKQDLDVGESLVRAIARTYLERARPEDRPNLEKLVKDRIFGDTGKVEFEGKTVKLAEKLNLLAQRAKAQVQKGSDSPSLAQVAQERVADSFRENLSELMGDLKK
jgi:hypothetical protein